MGLALLLTKMSSYDKNTKRGICRSLLSPSNFTSGSTRALALPRLNSERGTLTDGKQLLFLLLSCEPNDR